MAYDTCVSCGNYVPEGDWVCKSCMAGASERIVNSAINDLETALRDIRRSMKKLALVSSPGSGRIDNPPGFDSVREDVLAE